MTLKRLTAISFALTVFASTEAFAQDDYQLSCDTNISSNIIFANNELLVMSNKDEQILFKSTGIVELDGKPISLSQDEKKLAQRYYNEVEATIPIVVDITVDAIRITNLALTEVFNGLLGPDSELPKSLSGRLNKVADTVKSHVYQNPDSLTFNSDNLKDDLGLEDNLETEIEAVKQELVSTVIGELMVTFGKAMLSGDSDFSQLEKRMSNVGEDIDKKAEILSKVLEEKSTDLCARIKIIDQTETQLRSIDALRNLDTIQFKKA